LFGVSRSFTLHRPSNYTMPSIRRLTIASEMNVGGPLLGWRRRLVTRLLRPVYVREIAMLG
jgi:hypothetical protein